LRLLCHCVGSGPVDVCNVVVIGTVVVAVAYGVVVVVVVVVFFVGVVGGVGVCGWYHCCYDCCDVVVLLRLYRCW